MSKRYSIAEARASLPAIVDKAEAGVKVELTRRGKPVALVVSLREFERLQGSRPRFRELYKNYLRTHPLADTGLDADFAPSARDTSMGRKVTV